MSQQPLVLESPQKMRAHSAQARLKGRRIGLVPTMGALHKGHLSLVDFARQNVDELVVSIFVNPLQFDNSDDLSTYPRTWQADLALCAEHGADAVYAPRAETMYPTGFQSSVTVAEMTKGLCGAHRPGHFNGVTTVVMKLFGAVQPDLAVFGEKDFQQFRVLERMAQDLDLAVKVLGRPIVRDPDGLALSSRNVRLSPEGRQKALGLNQGLTRARELARDGRDKVAELVAAAREEMTRAGGVDIEYLEVVEEHTLEPLEALGRPGRMCVAAWVGGVRLIDNMALN